MHSCQKSYQNTLQVAAQRKCSLQCGLPQSRGQNKRSMPSSPALGLDMTNPAEKFRNWCDISTSRYHLLAVRRHFEALLIPDF